MPIHPGTIGLIDIPPDRCMNPDLWALVDRKKEQAKRATIEALQEAGDYAASCHITLALENVLHPQEILHSPQQMIEILDAVDLANVKGLVDVGHANRVGLNPADFIRRLGDKLCHVHLSDNDGTCDLHLPLGDGTIDFQSVLVQLAAMDYQDAVIIEIVGDKESDFLRSETIFRSVIE